MKVFVTGATGWIGSAVVEAVVGAGHEVLGLSRSDAGATALQSKGAQVLRGDLDDLDSLRAGAADADAVVHLANKHDFEHPEVSNAAERGAVQTLGDALSGSGRTLLIASGVAGLAQGRISTETDRSPAVGPDSPRGGSENLALDFVGDGVRSISVRFAPTVHGVGDHGFIAALVGIAAARGVSGYPGDGANRWPAVHRLDAARLVLRAIEQPEAGAILHAVAEEGVTTRDIATAIGAQLGLPVVPVAAEDVVGHFGWIGRFFAVDMPSSSAWTRAHLDWTPTGPTLLEDLAAGAYAGAG